MQINIVRSSVKKNPNAGNTRTVVAGRSEHTINYTGPLPKYLNDRIDIRRQQGSSDGPTETEFTIIDGNIPDELYRDKNAQIEIEKHNHIVHHLPEPSYLFSYEDPIVKCSDCGTETNFSKIEEDWIDDEYHVYMCPHCGSSEGYPDFIFEPIEEVLKELEL